MTVILFTQEVGSRGDEVAAGVAARLGLELVAPEQVEQLVAGQMHIGKFSMHHRPHGSGSLVERWTIGRHRLVRQMTAEVASIAARGSAVVRGWVATAQLRPVRRIFRVHIHAPEGDNTSAPERTLCCKSQQGHDVFPPILADRFGRRGPYDLVLKTERTPVDVCVEQVCRLVHGPQFPPTDFRAAPAELTWATSSLTSPALEVDIAGDTIRLPAGACHEEAIARVERHLRGRKSSNATWALSSCPTPRQGIL